MDYLLLVSGLIILIACGDFLVKGSVNLALRLNIPPIIIGLTIVSIGTSAPELFASIKAVNLGASGMSVGNVVGSNIANLALVLGITCLIFPVAVKRSLLRNEWLVLVFITFLFVLVSLDGTISAVNGWTFLITLALYMGFLVYSARKSKANAIVDIEEGAKIPKPWFWIGLYLLIGLIGLYFGAEWLISGAIGIAKSYNVDDFTIGVTVVAFGTSVPELATSAIAAFKKESDISIGNLIGSNIFNILGVLGATSLVQPLPIADSVLTGDFIWMVAVVLILFPMIYFSQKISRYSGLLLFAGYVAYVYLALI